MSRSARQFTKKFKDTELINYYTKDTYELEIR